MNQSIVDTIFEKQNKLVQKNSNFLNRTYFSKFKTSHSILGIIGPRGVGKTSYLIHSLSKAKYEKRKGLYISGDDMFFNEEKLYDLIDYLYKEFGTTQFFIDEIHRYPNWAQELKNIYDLYSDELKIIFSGSSVIDIVKEKDDLSRRAILRRLDGFSFREFLEIKTKQKYPIMDLDQILKRGINPPKEITNTKRLMGLFHEYLNHGYYPFMLNLSSKEEIYEAINGAIDKIINIDIASYYNLKTNTLSVLRKILYFIFTSPPSSINPHKLARYLEKDNKDVADYLDMLKESGLLRYLLIDKLGYSMIKNAEKVYLDNPNLAHAISYSSSKPVSLGAIRELFILNQLEIAGYKPFYTKDGDIACNEYIFEIGGKNKSYEQLKNTQKGYLVLDDIILGNITTIPMYLFGFLY